MYDTFGKAAIRFGLVYVRRRYRREIRFGAGFVALAVGVVVAYFASRNVPEG